MRTCFNTITAGADKPLEEIIAACGAVEFAGVEIDVEMLARCLSHMRIAELKERLVDAGLAVVSLMAFNLEVFGDPTGELKRIRDAANQAQELGAATLLTYCAADVPDTMCKEEALQRAGERAALYADAAAPVAIALEPIGGTTVMGGPQNAMEIARLSDRRNVGIMMDTFHYYRSRVPAEEIRAIPRDKLLVVHINDAEDLPIDQLDDSKRLHVGRGILPLEEDICLWREIGYDGYVSVELFRPEYWAQPVEQVVREAKESLDRLLAAAGALST